MDALASIPCSVTWNALSNIPSSTAGLAERVLALDALESALQQDEAVDAEGSTELSKGRSFRSSYRWLAMRNVS